MGGALRRKTRLWLEDRALRLLLGLLRLLPYRWRVPFAGFLTAALLAPLAGYRRRIAGNLDLALPGLSPKVRRQLIWQASVNMGRAFAELYSGQAFAARACAAPFEGPGLAALQAAKAEGRPALLVTGHFGNYDACRVGLLAQGYPVGGLYRPMKNPFFNRHYVAAIEALGKPLFPRGRAGFAGMLRHLQKGGMLGLVADQHMQSGAELRFFGLRAQTALSAAELALRLNAPLIPLYAIRQADGLSFRCQVEAPIPLGTPEAMTQALNDSLERLVRAYPGQWLWAHRRWKAEEAARAAGH